MNVFPRPTPRAPLFSLRTSLSAGVCPFVWILALLILLSWWQSSLFGQTNVNANGGVTIVELEGQALHAMAGSDQWAKSQIGQVLAPGDRFRTLERSRAVLRLTDLSLLRLGEISSIEIPAPATNRPGGLRLFRGIFYYFHRDKPGVLPVTTPSAHAVVLGTEFVVAVDDNGNTRLDLIDGSVRLTNDLGSLELHSGETATANRQSGPVQVAAPATGSAIQWVLHYPAVLDVNELGLTDTIANTLRASLDAYQSGDVLQALALYPNDRLSNDRAETIYLASLQLAVGLTDSAAKLLTKAQDAPTDRLTRLAAAVTRLADLVRVRSAAPAIPPETATECLAESFVRQSESRLPDALEAARQATIRSPDFSRAWARVGELEFGFGRIDRASAATARAQTLSPRLASAKILAGFLFAAQQRTSEAETLFTEAISLNGGIGDAWLGRGLCRIRRGLATDGLADLQTAVSVEPQRALFRSYLAKAYQFVHDPKHARQEIQLAQQLDARDPTAWLYSALLRQDANQGNEAVSDLERSKSLNDQRSVFRSRSLLDQDQAVRSVNLAAIYQDVGLVDYSVREASAATALDYANPSAHLFLANSYNALRDPQLAQLRYETPTVSEYLIANLLAPVGVTSLSSLVSQQEYAPLFEQGRPGITSDTRYTSDGSLAQDVAVHGGVDKIGYALEGSWRHSPGFRANSDFEQWLGSGQAKIQLSPETSAYLLASYATVNSGDTRQFYDEGQASRTLRFDERQEPNVFAGLHHQWSPGAHTLFLGAHLNDTARLTEPTAGLRTLMRDGGGVVTNLIDPASSLFGLRYRSVLNAWSGELQQIFQAPQHLLMFGGRFQSGELETQATVSRDPFAFPPVFTDPADQRQDSGTFNRGSLYSYGHWQPVEPLRLIAGGSYEWVRFPRNFDAPPIADGHSSRAQWSPKAGFIWSPQTNLNLRGAYTRSLGGVSYDNSVRLEPTQIAGFVQSFRSLAPESRVGQVPGTSFETFALGLDQRWATRTYFTLDGEWLRSDGHRSIGVFDYLDAPPFLATPGTVRENVEFEERSLAITLGQLVGSEWAFSARYRISDANLRTGIPSIPANLDVTSHVNAAALLHRLDLTAIYQHPSGAFAQAEALWRRQHNRRDDAGLTDEDLWQFNLWGGWRFAQRRVEISVGLLNLTDRNYRLNPLNSFNELPRERMLATRVRWSF